MKNLFLAISTLIVFSATAKAETFNCVFTEPFFSFTYSTSKETLSLNVMDEKKSVIKKVSFQIDDKGSYLLKSATGKLLATLILDNNGSDGMSDYVFPFTALYVEGDQPLYGGCDSTLLKRKELN